MLSKKVEAKYLLLSCMDHRHMDDVVRVMQELIKGEEGIPEGEEPVDLYDHLILAGASLGAVQSSHPAWGQTFWDHLTIARKLHTKIHTVILLQHEYCGAFQHFLGTNALAAHQRVALTLGQQIQAREGFRDLKVQYWMLKHLETTEKESRWGGVPLFPDGVPES